MIHRGLSLKSQASAVQQVLRHDKTSELTEMSVWWILVVFSDPEEVMV